MVLAMAISLAGFDPQDYSGLIAKLDPHNKPSCIGTKRSSSPILSESSVFGSATSLTISSLGSSPRSSPFSSRRSSIQSNDGNAPSQSKFWSRPSTPTDELFKDKADETLIPTVEEPKKRDILDLAANLKDSRWQIVHPLLPHHDYQSYLSREFVRQDDDDVEEHDKEEYPMRCCSGCNFIEPSPYLFGESYSQKKSSKNESESDEQKLVSPSIANKLC